MPKAKKASDTESAGSKKRRTSDEKAAAVARLVSGETLTAVSADTKIPTSTLHDWANEVGGVDLLRQARVEELVFDYLRENLNTLAAQSRHARDLEWLKGQNAADLAVLHGVLSDKSTRILAAIERASRAAVPDEGTAGAEAPAGPRLGP